MKRTLMLLLSSIFVIVGCSNFEEINTNPDKTTKVTSSMLATNMLKALSELDNSSQKGFIYDDFRAHYLAFTETAQANDQFNLLGRASFSSMQDLRNINNMIEYAPEGKLRNSYTALSHFIRAYIFFYNTMKVGDIPYTEAAKGEENVFFPKYDTQKDIFIGLLNELDEADRLFAEGEDFAGDIFYNGDCDAWRKAVNVMKLKILIQLYNKTSDPDLKVKERFSKVLGLPLFESIDNNLQLVYSDKDGQKYPLYREVNSYTTYEVITATITDKLKELGDYRLFHYADMTPKAVADNLAQDDWDAYDGVEPSLEEYMILLEQNNGVVSGINRRYEEVVSGEPVYFLSYQEMNFILAEAAVRGIISGDAQAYYAEGIRSSMKFTDRYTPEEYNHGRKMTDSYIESYISSDKVALGGTMENKVSQIIWQKFFTNFLQSPSTTFFETRRTGTPELIVNPKSNQSVPADRLPLRWMYPNDEINYNSDNVNEALQRQFGGSDTFIGEMWILK